MNQQELEIYVDTHRNELIAEAIKYLDEEDGVWTYWGDVAMCVYFDQWEYPENENRWYRICAFPVVETTDGMMEESLDFSTYVAEIKTRGTKE